MSIATGVLDRAAGRSARSALRVRRARGAWLPAFTVLVIIWLLLPIAGMIAFSFNATKGKFNFTWQGFTLHWWTHAFDLPGLTSALLTSLSIAALCALLSAIVGTPLGIALARHRFRGRASTDVLLFANIAAPEVVLGSALLSILLTLGLRGGYLMILLSHVMFSLAYVAVTVRARMVGTDESLEEAARDLGAGPWTTFRLVTGPLLAPAIAAGALLAFALSIDDYIITSFVNGSTTTFPLWVYSQTKIGVPPQVNVIGTMIFVVGVLAALANGLMLQHRGARA